MRGTPGLAARSGSDQAKSSPLVLEVSSAEELPKTKKDGCLLLPACREAAPASEQPLCKGLTMCSAAGPRGPGCHLRNSLS